MVEDSFTDEYYGYRRHPVRRFFGRLLLVLVLLAVAAGVVAWRFQPLSDGETYGVRGDRVQEATSVGGSSVVTYGAGETFDMLFSVRNDGPVDVRILAVPDTELRAVMASYEVRVMPRGATAYDEEDAEPFGPFRLRPGETRLLNLSHTFRDCGEAATAGNRTVRHQPVRYELFGRVERVAEVELRQPLVITGMPAC